MMSWLRSRLRWGLALAVGVALAAACGREAPLDVRVDRLLQQRDYAQALDMVSAALRKEPEAWPVHDLRIRVFLAAGRPDEALSAYAARWSSGGPESPALFRQVAIALLREALEGEDGLLRTRAAAALAGFASPDLLPVFRAALRNPDPSVRALVVQGAGRIPGEEAGRLVRDSLYDLEALVRAAAAKTLTGRDDAQTRAALERAIHDPSREVAVRAVAALARSGEASAFALLRQRLRDPEDSIRMQVAEALGHLGKPEAAPDLRALLLDPNPYVQVYAAEALARLNDPSGREALRRALRHPNRSVALYAAEAFSNLGDATGAARLIETLTSGGDLSARLYAAWTLARLGDPRGEPVLEEFLRHGEAQVRMQASWTLGQMQDDAGIPALRRAVSDAARPVRLQAAWALAGKLGETQGTKRVGG
jgi:HEAT repeat protein